MTEVVGNAPQSPEPEPEPEPGGVPLERSASAPDQCSVGTIELDDIEAALEDRPRPKALPKKAAPAGRGLPTCGWDTSSLWQKVLRVSVAICSHAGGRFLTPVRNHNRTHRSRPRFRL